MKCEKAQEQLTALLAKELAPELQSELQAHLAECPKCRQEHIELSATWSRLDLLDDQEPSPKLQARFDAMLSAYSDGLEQAQTKTSLIEAINAWLEGFWPRKPVFGMGVAGLFLVLGLVTGLGFKARDSGNDELGKLRDEIQTIRQMVALSLLKQSSASERLRGVSFSQYIEASDERVLMALLHTLNYDSNVNVRLAVIEALFLFYDKALVKEGLLNSLPKQSSPLVQVTLIDLMVEMREPRLLDVLDALRRDENTDPNVKERAEWGLQQLSEHV